MSEFINSTKSFLGRGWGFPVSFSKGAKQVKMLEGEDDIKSSLEVILQTTLGERVMQPNFGGSLQNFVFDAIDVSFTTMLTDQIRVAIVMNEPRAQLLRIEFTEDPLIGRVDLIIHYKVLSTNSRYNIVFPFYLNEGTDIQE